MPLVELLEEFHLAAGPLLTHAASLLWWWLACIDSVGGGIEPLLSGLELDASCPSGARNHSTATGKVAEVLVVDEACTCCCTLAALGPADSGCTGSFAYWRRLIGLRFVPALVPLELAVYLQLRPAVAVEHPVLETCSLLTISGSWGHERSSVFLLRDEGMQLRLLW